MGRFHRTYLASLRVIVALIVVFAYFGNALAERKVAAYAVSAVCQGPTISGYVYFDANQNGLKDGGEAAITNSPIELRNASNTVVGSTTTDSNGYYEFSVDATINPAPTTLTRTATFSDMTTDWTRTATVTPFDSTLGSLTSVTVTNQATISSTVKVENSSVSAETISSTVSGNVVLAGPGVPALTANVALAPEPFSAQPFDGTIDFGGASGHDFGPRNGTNSNAVTVTDAPSLATYSGAGTLTFTASAEGTSNVSASGNVLTSIQTSAAAQVTVQYAYTPCPALRPGSYTIVQTAQPGGYVDGAETAGNVAPIPNSIGTDTIPVTLAASNLTNNNFGERVLPTATATSTATATATSTAQPTATATTPAGLATPTTPAGNVTPTATTPPGLPQPGLTPTATATAPIPVPATPTVPPGATTPLPSSLAGCVYLDLNNNGIFDAGEAGIPGVTITLSGTNDLGSAVVQATLTASNGCYSFTNLRPGLYTITESQPNGYIDGKTTIGTPGGVTTTNQFSQIVLGQAVYGINNNFGELLPTGGSTTTVPTTTVPTTVVAPTATTPPKEPQQVVPTPTPVVPELPPLWLFGTGLLSLAWLGYRRR